MNFCTFILLYQEVTFLYPGIIYLFIYLFQLASTVPSTEKRVFKIFLSEWCDGIACAGFNAVHGGVQPRSLEGT